MPTYGPWMDDGGTVEVYAGDGSSVSGANHWGYTSTSGTVGTPADRVQRAWDGTGAGFGGGVTEGTVQSAGMTLEADGIWTSLWIPSPRLTATATTGSLPAGTLSDPNVIGVEWEPTSTPLSHRLVVTAESVNGAAMAAGLSSPVKLVDNTGVSIYKPGFQTAATLNALGTVGTINFPSNLANAQSVSVSIPDVPMDSTPGYFAVCVIDPVTANFSASTAFGGGVGTVSFRVSALLWAVLRPRYRLIYSDTPAAAVAAATRVTPSLRMLQRGGAGGMSGIPRMVGNPTRRGSLRQGPGSVF